MKTKTIITMGAKKWKYWVPAFCCFLTFSIFFGACKKDQKKTNYVVTLQKIDGGDSITEGRPWIHWGLNVTPLNGSYSVLKMATCDSETAQVALDKHGQKTIISNGSSIQYMQGYPLFERGHRYAYQVDVCPGKDLPLVSSNACVGFVPDRPNPLNYDNLEWDYLQNANVHLDGGKIAVDVSWKDSALPGDQVKVDILEVACCGSGPIADPMWVGPNGEWPWYKPGGHLVGGGAPVCQWELAKNRQQYFIDHPATLGAPFTPILTWLAGFGNSVITTNVTYDENKCYLMQITEQINGWKNTFYIHGSL